MKNYLAIFFMCFCFVASAQNNASPYSIIGLGDFEKSYFDKTSAMGHSGVALVSDKFVLLSNPASLSFLAKPMYQNPFYIDIATRYKSSNFTNSSSSQALPSANDMQFQKLTFSIKPKDKWGISFGLLPFSNSNYTFNSLKNVQGSNISVNANYTGKGSTNLLYISNGFSINKKLSLGLQTSLLFGNFSNREVIFSAITDSGLVSEENVFVSKIMFKGGMIYKDTLSKDFAYSFGATGSFQNRLSANYTTRVIDGTTELKNTQEQIRSFTQLPTMFTLGVALNYKKNLTLVADYTHQDWNALNIRGFNYTISSYNKIGFGAEYHFANVDKRKKKGESYLQIGYYTTNGYLNVGATNISDNAFTVGYGKQFLDARLAVQINAEFGSRGIADFGLVKESFTQIGLTVCYRDFWNTRKIKRYN
jgi:hypothetical protein